MASRKRVWIDSCTGALLLLVGIFLLTGCGRPGETLVLPVAGTEWRSCEPQVAEGPVPTEQEPLEDTSIYVHVCGAVCAPGVVRLPLGSRGWDAVQAAGGFAEGAAETAVNLAAVLTDGMQLYVPTCEEAAEAATVFGTSQPADGRVNINTADRKTLCTLPGIGEAKAEDIIKYREQNGCFQSPEDIMRVPGIKEGAYGKMKDKIVVK